MGCLAHMDIEVVPACLSCLGYAIDPLSKVVQVVSIGSLRWPTCARLFMPQIKFPRDGSKLLSGGSLTDFGFPIIFFLFLIFFQKFIKLAMPRPKPSRHGNRVGLARPWSMVCMHDTVARSAVARWAGWGAGRSYGHVGRTNLFELVRVWN